MKQPIYMFVDKDQTRKYTSEIKSCKKCGVECLEILYVREYWGREASDIEFYCPNCINKIKPKGQVNSEYPVIVTTTIPKDSIPRIFLKPSLTTGRNVDLFEAASLPSEITVDNCKISHNPNRNIQPDALENIEKANKEIERADSIIKTDSQALDILTQALKAKPEIKDDQKKYLDYDAIISEDKDENEEK